MHALTLETTPLSIPDVVHVARGGAPIHLGKKARAAILASRAVVDRAVSDGLAHYGINTGFGSLARQRIAPESVQALQRNLVRSHAAGVGEPLPCDTVRAMMLLLAASLSRGLSGVRPEVVELLVGMLNAGVTPIVPSVGSVGASGDLAPLAHLSMVLLGEGEAQFGGLMMAGDRALAAAGLIPITLEAKEGLALINGTHLMAAQGALFVHDAQVLFEAALVAAAMSIDASRGTDSFLDDRVHAARNQPGQRRVAEKLRGLLHGSKIIPSHRENDPRVQDPYSLRCTPQVLGAAWDALQFVRARVESELGAVTDNPLVFAATSEAAHDEIISAGNFHGMPLAIPLDCAAIAISHIAGIAERRIFWMLSAFDAEAHLKPYLSPKPGLNSGLMIVQYTAAACCNEIIGLCTPASPANISTSAGIEDYNSFGPRSAAKARRALDLATNVVAIELLCAAQGLEFQRPLTSGPGVERAYNAIRARVTALADDRSPAPDIAAVTELIRNAMLGAEALGASNRS